MARLGQTGGDMDTRLDNQPETIPYMLFRIQNRLCGIPLAHVVETMRPLPVEAIAGAPAMVKGAAVIRGAPLPVVDLATLWEDESEPPRRFITIKAGERQLALAVTSVEGLHYLPEEVIGDVPPLLSGARANAVDAIGTLDNELLMILNSSHIIPESVWLSIQSAGEAS